jgi:DNA-binding transcriptional LysR family regulator
VTPNQLRTFLAVVDSGSVRAAADKLFVSQPAVSSVLGQLRTELGVALFARHGRGILLTPAGEVLADYARQLLGLLEEAAVATRSEADPELGTLRLAAVTTAGEHLAPTYLAAFRSRHPRVGLMLEVGNRQRTWQALRERRVDLAIGGRPPTGAGLTTLAIRPNRLVVVSARPSGYPGGPMPVTRNQLATSTWLLREPGSGTRATAEEFLDFLGLAPATLTLGSNGAVRQAVHAGLGVTLMSDDALDRDLRDGSLVEWQIEGLPLVREWHLVARDDRALPATARLMVDELLAAEQWTPASDWLAGSGRSGVGD